MSRAVASATDVEDGETTTEASTSSSSQGHHPILEVFKVMQPRKVRRAHHSRVPRRGLAGHVSVTLQILIMFVILANLLNISVYQIGLQKYTAIPIIFTVALVVPTIVHTAYTPENTFTAWVSTEVNVFCMWAAWLFKNLRSGREEVKQATCVFDMCLQQEIMVLGKVFIIILGLTCSLYIIKWVVLKCIMKVHAFQHFAAIHWHLARPVKARPGLTTFSYRPGGWLGWNWAEFTYRGSLDELGRPHGRGMWSDTSFHGECLHGVWVHGVPAGQFTSLESGSGAQFLQRAVGYATSRADCQARAISKKSIIPRKADKLRYGQAQVEVSFAGGFFPFLPSVEFHSAEPSLADLVDALLPPGAERRMRCRTAFKLEVVSHTDLSSLRDDEGAPGFYHYIKLPVQFLEGNHVGFVTQEALSQVDGLVESMKSEALVFIHGYNCELSTALERVAQTFALGNMSPHIVPFVFSYSSGQTMQYFSAKSHMKEYGDDFATFLGDLANHFEEVHILTHSCGAEFLFANWSAIAQCFQPARRQTGAYSQWKLPPRWVPQGQRSDSEGRLHLATLTLMNPDVLVDTVVRLLPEVMQVAEHFTTYNDANDGALFYSGWLQKLVPRWYQERPWAQETAVFGKSLKSLWVERSNDGIHLRGDLMKEHTKGPIYFKSFSGADFSESWPSGPTVPGDGSIDIINCSTIDQNVHTLRHNYYMLNTQMVEDVCELIGGRLTAAYRQRLCQTNANIFNFLSPPSYLKE